MKNSLCSMLATMALPAVVFGGFWSDADESLVRTSNGEKWVSISEPSRMVVLEESALVEALMVASEAGDSLLLDLPLPDGSSCQVRVESSPVVEPALQDWMDRNGFAIRTYAVEGSDGDRVISGRFDVGGPDGLRGRFISEEGVWLIEPVYKGNQVLHQVYFRGNLRGEKLGRCVVREIFPDSPVERLDTRVTVNRPGERLELRLAAAVTGEFTAAFGGTLQGGLSGLVSGINRVNAVYARDMGLTFVLVAGTEQFIFTNGATDPFNNNDESVMIDQNAPLFNNSIGINAYDIGHSFGTGGQGGIADTGVVCRSSKANSATSLPNPASDLYWIDIAAHEMGHQLNAGHTFSTTAGFCGSPGQYDSGSAYEPGGGTTIMAYSGICNQDDINPFQNDPYFHAFSIQQMTSYLASQACGSLLSTTNANKPTVNAGIDRMIPPSTPFRLTATGSDGDGDSLTYSWEQFDRALAPANIANGDKGNNPLFRSFFPTASPTRYFPRADSLLSGAGSFGETLPTVGRNLTFRVTARDNNPQGGLTAFDDVVLTVNATLPPFTVTSPSENNSVEIGGSVAVNWQTAGLVGTGVDGPVQVAILTDVGGIQMIPISEQIAFSAGTATVPIPVTLSPSSVRLVVTSTSNYFLAVTPNRITLAAPTPPSFSRVSVESAEVAGNGNSIFGPGGISQLPADSGKRGRRIT